MKGANMSTLEFDPETAGAEDVYRYGRKPVLGPVEGHILSAHLKQWEDGGKQLVVVLGLPTYDTGKDGAPLGNKIDCRIKIPSPEYFGLVTKLQPELAKAKGTIDLPSWRDRAIRCIVTQEKDRSKSQATGQTVMKAVVAPSTIVPK